MINLLEFFPKTAILPLQDQPYHELMEQLVNYCLADCDNTVKQQALLEIRSKSKTRSPQDINLGRGFALIHAKTNQVKEIHTAVGILVRPKKLLKGERIQNILCIILPESQSRTYLSLLARLGRMLRHKDAAGAFSRAGKLFSSGNSEEAKDTVIELFRQFEQGQS